MENKAPTYVYPKLASSLGKIINFCEEGYKKPKWQITVNVGIYAIAIASCMGLGNSAILELKNDDRMVDAHNARIIQRATAQAMNANQALLQNKFKNHQLSPIVDHSGTIIGVSGLPANVVPLLLASSIQATVARAGFIPNTHEQQAFITLKPAQQLVQEKVQGSLSGKLGEKESNIITTDQAPIGL